MSPWLAASATSSTSQSLRPPPLAAGGVGPQPDDDVNARVLQVERVGVALRAVADHGHGLALERREVGSPRNRRLAVSAIGREGISRAQLPRRSFPCELRGSSREELIRFGTLWGARRSRQNSRSSSSPRRRPRRARRPRRRHCCHSGSSTPVAAASATAGCASSACSTCSGETFSPPVTMTSSARPSTCRCPSSSMRPRSPVRSQPSPAEPPRRDRRPRDQDRARPRSAPPWAGSACRPSRAAAQPRPAGASSPARPPR